ncbi:Sas10/Utp3/C1D-like protein [Cordyceps fumosorosea ARSEF 2679]|uniref:Sas10/Utp3/C1D-like protein n=1 Tax=Cordyceps fumosorosea (strain ARSEF 2679) TaxID=1081104 RepID=A0A168B2R8_CORFA|nr:Sas10/Utp3/C1D-like protein [Cordyceps fumosorosea ARSEF 2679]OAA69538.1 Sas10/Utp3/C1D-like protein [Cordyceps fumosorosea ARSEF 2679]
MAAPTTLPALLEQLKQSLLLTQEAAPALSTIEHPKDGISLLDVKNEVLLSYLENLVFLILLKIRKSKISSETPENGKLDEQVRSKLVELRLYLEKGVRPLEEKLRFSIERFLRTADDAQREEQAKQQKGTERTGSESDEDESGSGSDVDEDDEDEDEEAEQQQAKSTARGKMSAAPKFGNLVDDVTARPAQRDGALSGVYRPPKRDRQVMDTGARREKVDRRPNKSRTMEEFVKSELSAAPMAEPSIGTTILQGGRRMKTAADRQAEDERREYEETNYTRLPKESKKEKAKKARQEGGSRRMQFGGEEWHDLGEGVDRIDRLTKRKDGGRGANVRAMLDKSRKRGRDTTDGPRGSGHEIGERFNKKVKMLEAGRGKRK